MKLHAHALMEMGHDLKFSLKGAAFFTCFRGAFKSRYGPHGYAACVYIYIIRELDRVSFAIV